MLGAKGCEISHTDMVAEVFHSQLVFGSLSGCRCASADEPLLWQWPATAVRRRRQRPEGTRQMSYVAGVVDSDVDKFREPLPSF